MNEVGDLPLTARLPREHSSHVIWQGVAGVL